MALACRLDRLQRPALKAGDGLADEDPPLPDLLHDRGPVVIAGAVARQPGTVPDAIEAGGHAALDPRGAVGVGGDGQVHAMGGVSDRL